MSVFSKTNVKSAVSHFIGEVEEYFRGDHEVDIDSLKTLLRRSNLEVVNVKKLQEVCRPGTQACPAKLDD